MNRKILVIALAYFGATVGAGFASGQEVLQYFVAYGWWGVGGALIASLLIPVSATAVLQYGSYFRAQSHGQVFDSITSRVMAVFLDHSLNLAQFCLGFVMLAGAGANLHQQFGWPVWLGSTLMVLLVLAAGMVDVDRVTAVISAITPAMVALLVVVIAYSVVTFDGTLQGVHDYAVANVTQPLPTWWLSSLNYIGLAMFCGISIAILIGGANWNPKVAGRGGLYGALLFTLMLALLTVALLLQVENVNGTSLPTLTLMNQIHPALGFVAAIAIYLMIFSTALSVLFSTGKRLSVSRPGAYRPIFAAVTLLAFVLSFLPFTDLVNRVYPLLGWLGMVFVAVLLVSWLRNGRTEIGEEALRRDRIRSLILRRLHPRRDWNRGHRAALLEDVDESNLEAAELGDLMSSDIYGELDQTTELDVTPEQVDSLGERLERGTSVQSNEPGTTTKDPGQP